MSLLNPRRLRLSQSLRAVSILVILDVALKPKVRDVVRRSVGLFQSLLSWMSLLNQIVKERAANDQEVSILVILDVALKRDKG